MQLCQLPCTPFSKPVPFLLSPGSYWNLTAMILSRIVTLEIRRQIRSARIRSDRSIRQVGLHFSLIVDMEAGTSSSSCMTKTCTPCQRLDADENKNANVNAKVNRKEFD